MNDALQVNSETKRATLLVAEVRVIGKRFDPFIALTFSEYQARVFRGEMRNPFDGESGEDAIIRRSIFDAFASFASYVAPLRTRSATLSIPVCWAVSLLRSVERIRRNALGDDARWVCDEVILELAKCGISGDGNLTIGDQ